jgi:hypothetical protein
MKKTASSLKTGYDKKNDGQIKNKTWKCKANDNKKSTKNDLAAFVRKQTRKELHAFAKKRKVDDDKEEGEQKDDESDASLNNFEIDNVDFSKMDFSKDSDDEFSI